MSQSLGRPKVLVLVQYYLPGFRSGGPVRSIDGLQAHLGDKFEFRIVAYDRDSGSKVRYPGVKPEQWSRVGQQWIYYLPKDRGRWRAILKVLNNSKCDLIYIQSLFNPCFTIWPLLARRLRLFKNMPILLAPRGELSSGALSLKPWRKRVALRMFVFLRLLRDVSWQATAKEEIDVLQKLNSRLGKKSTKSEGVFLAPNLKRLSREKRYKEEVGGKDILRMVFLSRITPMKNLDYALNVLRLVKKDVIFRIYGPIDRDLQYWEMCRSMIQQLGENISVEVMGVVDPCEVDTVFGNHDLLFLPTKGENFGHVILESLIAGCPVLISDQTPWRDLVSKKAGWDLSLDRPEGFIEVIEKWGGSSRDAKIASRLNARAAGIKFLNLEQTVSDNFEMLSECCSGKDE